MWHELQANIPSFVSRGEAPRGMVMDGVIVWIVHTMIGAQGNPYNLLQVRSYRCD